MARVALFATTLDRGDPDAPWRWAVSLATVAIAVILVMTVQWALHLRPHQPADDPAPTTVVQLGDADEYIDERALEIALTSPHAPTAPPPAEVEPDAPLAQDRSALSNDETLEPPQMDTPPLITADSSGMIEPQSLNSGPLAPTLDGDPSGGDVSRVSGPSAELARGEMATCIVRRHDASWSVEGCATGLHSDAIDLAASSRAGAKVMVTLRGA